MHEEELHGVTTDLYRPPTQPEGIDYEPYVMDLAHALPEPVPVIRWHSLTVGSEGNISAVVGEAKSKKTFLASAIAAGMLSREGYMAFGPQPGRVLWIDTEQAEAHVQRVMARVHRMAGYDPRLNHDRFWTLALRELDPKVRAGVAFAAIENLRPRLAVIDGIGDLQYDTNDLRESERIVTDLMRISSQLSCHILCVLHTNPNSDKARGHTGSALQRKSESVLFVHRAGEASIVDPQFCRNEPFDRFAFTIDEEGLPVACDMPIAGAGSGDPCVMVLRDELGGAAERIALIRRVAEKLGCTEAAARMRVLRGVKTGRLALSGDGCEISIPW